MESCLVFCTPLYTLFSVAAQHSQRAAKHIISFFGTKGSIAVAPICLYYIASGDKKNYCAKVTGICLGYISICDHGKCTILAQGRWRTCGRTCGLSKLF